MRRQPQTPIEKAIAEAKGEPRNPRQAKYVAKRNMVGMRRVSVWVPAERAEEIHDVARGWVAEFLNIEGKPHD